MLKKGIFSILLSFLAPESPSEISFSNNIPEELVLLMKEDLAYLVGMPPRTPGPEARKIFNMEILDGESLFNWLDERIHFISINRDISSHALNRGRALYREFLKDGQKRFYSFQESPLSDPSTPTSHLSVTSPRVGIVELGNPFLREKEVVVPNTNEELRIIRENITEWMKREHLFGTTIHNMLLYREYYSRARELGLTRIIPSTYEQEHF